MDIEYRKNSNTQLFLNLEKNLDIDNLQNYIPLYNNFFNINENNHNSINLDTKYRLVNISKNKNNLIAKLNDENNNELTKDVFIKYSPLLDPIKYMIGKTKIEPENLLNLPNFSNNNNIDKKIVEPNNSAYVDGFFSYLTDKLLRKYNFIHGLEFYGSFLGIKNNFLVNIEDDVDFLNESEFFYKNITKLFKFKSSIHYDMFNINTRTHKKRLHIADNISSLSLSNIDDFEHLNNIFETNSVESTNEDAKVEYETNLETNPEANDTNSECSSRTSNTNSYSEDIDDEEEEEEEEEEDEDEVYVSINQFPVHAICLEKCKTTLDNLIVNSDVSEGEWGSMVMQILFMLITYQKMINLTHNDLHTTNIMYNDTDKEFLYYKYNNKHYKIPTFGRIFKIIDFGRAIYKFRGNVICSDSFYENGDASTQYNFEPFFNKKKPRLEPNFSFDLCRLGCALYDFIVEDDDPENLTGIYSIIANWCYDNKDRNILYKTNGEERYPEFKLYKMIVRTVHKHTPQNVIGLSYFNRYLVKKIDTKWNIFNIDDLLECSK